MICGEMRWGAHDQVWEILTPSATFNNAYSSFFGQKPFRLVLPDMARLYEMIDAYGERHGARLVTSAEDPPHLLREDHQAVEHERPIRSDHPLRSLAADHPALRHLQSVDGQGGGEGACFPTARITCAIGDPYPQKTGSYEQASYAIQDTPEMMQQHYGRFLPEDKAAIAAQVLNGVWGPQVDFDIDAVASRRSSR